MADTPMAQLIDDFAEELERVERQSSADTVDVEFETHTVKHRGVDGQAIDRQVSEAEVTLTYQFQD